MTTSLPEVKLKIHQECLNIIRDKKQLILDRLKEIGEAANTESKSSMGDKYETTREMAAIERDNQSEQLSFLEQQERAINSIDPQNKNTRVMPGTLVKTGSSLYYIAVSLGRIVIDDITAYSISPVSPLGQLLLRAKKGDSVTLNGITHQIEELT